MASFEEVLAAMSATNDYSFDDLQYIIDDDLRTISIPSGGVILGVITDKDVNRVNFKMKRFYNGFDMSDGFIIRVNYVNANGSANYYTIPDADKRVTDTDLMFTWLVGSDAVAYNGEVALAVAFIKQTGGVITQKFNSTIAYARVLDGLDVDSYVPPQEQEDILTHLQRELDEYSQEKIIEINASIPKDYHDTVARIDALETEVGEMSPVLDSLADDMPIVKEDIETLKVKETQLKLDLSRVSESIEEITEKTMQNFGVPTIGVPTQSNDAEYFSSNQKRCGYFADLSQSDVIGIDGDVYSFAIGYCENNRTDWINNQSGSAWNYDRVTVPQTKRYRVIIKRNDSADLSNADMEFIANNFGIFGKRTVLKEGVVSERTLSEKLKNKINKENSKKYIHFSFDDVEFSLKNIVNNTLESIFDDPFFNMLLLLHENYGARFSLYVYMSAFNLMDNSHREEFTRCSDWLKFGMHLGLNENVNYLDTEYTKAKEDWQAFVEKAIQVCGQSDSIDRIPRLQNFAGSEASLNGMKDADCGILGMLSADDNRNTIYLSEKHQEYLRMHDKLIDEESGLMFLSTDMRLDWFTTGFSSSYEYDVPIKSNVYDELVFRYGTIEKADKYNSLIIFTHEWQIYDSIGGNINNDMVANINHVCLFANEYGFCFDYPQNRNNIFKHIVNNKHSHLLETDFVQGTTSASASLVDSTTRVRSGYLYFQNGTKIKIKPKNGYKYKLVTTRFKTKTDGKYTDTEWLTTETEQLFDGTRYCILVVSKIDNSIIEKNDGVDFYVIY